MDDKTRELYAQLLYTAAMSDPHTGLGSIILNVATHMCVNDTIYAKFMDDVHHRRNIYGVDKTMEE